MNVNDIRRHVTGGQTASQLERAPAQLHLAEHGGMLWATNRYWLTPAVRVAPLLEKFNLDPAVPGSYLVNGSIRSYEHKLPSLGLLMGKLVDYPEPIAPVTIGGRAAYVHAGARDKFMLAAYQTADGTAMGLLADAVDWLTDTSAMQLTRPRAFELPLEQHFGAVRVLSKGRGSAPVAFVADVIRTIKPGAHGPDETGRTVWHEAETENLGPRIVGLLQALKLEG